MLFVAEDGAGGWQLGVERMLDWDDGNRGPARSCFEAVRFGGASRGKRYESGSSRWINVSNETRDDDAGRPAKPT